MPVQQFETLGGFSKFNEVYTVGLEAAREVLKQWKEEGKLPTGLVDDVQAKSQAVKRGTRLRYGSFVFPCPSLLRLSG